MSQLTPAEQANLDYKNFIETPITDDPMRMVASVMLGLTNSQADMLRTMTANVTKLTQKMAEVNALLGKLNNAKVTATDAAAGQIAKSVAFSYTDPPNTAQLAARQSMIDIVQKIVDYGGTTAQAYNANNAKYDFTAGGASGSFNVGANISINCIPAIAPATGQVYQAYALKPALDSTSQNLTRTVDQISSEVQQAQVDLQTMMGRYNGSFEVVTAAIKKSESQAQSVNGNIRR